MSIRNFLVASSLAGAAFARPGSEVMEKRDPSATANSPAAVYTINNYDGIGEGSTNYNSYSGDGSVGAGWPAMDQWVSFVDMFNNNKCNLRTACEQYGVPNDSDEEIGEIYNGIQAIAKASNVDHRFILAEIIKESGGCVRVPTTVAPGTNDQINPGLMQDNNGYYTCNCEQNDKYNEDCGVVDPCPQNTITQMIREGTQGTNNGAGLATLINEAQAQGASGAQAFYVAAEWYNMGAYTPNVGGNLGSYAEHIANFLTGFTGCS